MADSLNSIPPSDAVEMHLESMEYDSADWTQVSHESHLRAFVEWCREHGGIDSMADLDGRDLYQFRIWRRNGGYSKGQDEELAPKTIHGALATIRSFLRFCAQIEAVESDLYERVSLPSLSNHQEVSDSTIDPDRVPAILDYLGQYEYASREHVIWTLIWHTGARTGGVRALDLGDVDLDGETPGLDYVHRPATGTPLKNNEAGERYNRISRSVAKTLRDYVDGPREDVEDDHGRRPLVSTRYGRVSPSSIRQTFYRWTRPCKVGLMCPHGEEPDTCEWATADGASACPSSRSPHDVRKARVTKYRNDGVPRGVVSDRLDASEDVLDKHYDRASEREKADRRWQFIGGSK